MKEAVGGTYVINIIIIFIFLVFAFFMAVFSYNKAFKVNSRIMMSIEKHEGFNNLSLAEITWTMETIGYRKGAKGDCPSTYDTGELVNMSGSQHQYCIYRFTIDEHYYAYGILTYMHIEVPFVGELIELPIFSKTDKIYEFNVR